MPGQIVILMDGRLLQVSEVCFTFEAEYEVALAGGQLLSAHLQLLALGGAATAPGLHRPHPCRHTVQSAVTVQSGDSRSYWG